MSKAGKKKGNTTTLSLTEFLGAMPSAPGGDQDWAAEDDSLALPTAPGELPSGPGGASSRSGPGGRGPRKPLPTQPPFTAFVGNLNFDILSDDIGEFFFEVGKCNIVEPRILVDRESGRSKGYGYVEFADLDSLKAALDLDGYMIADRPVKIDIAEPRANDSSRGSQRNSRYPDMPQREERAGGAINWRRDAPPEWSPAEPAPRGPPMRAGSGRGEPRPLSDHGAPRGEGAGNPFDKFDRSAPRPNLFADRPAPGEAAAPVQRKKLDLAPRTKPVEPLPVPVKKEEPAKEPEAEAAPKPAPVKKSNPFGAARPVDTTAKLREIEEKLAKAEAEKKAKDEEERKAKEEQEAAAAATATATAEDGTESRASSRGPRSPSAPGRGARSFSNSRGGSAAAGARGARGHGAGAPGTRPLPEVSKPKYGWGESARAKREAESVAHGGADGAGEFRTVGGGRGGSARGGRGGGRGADRDERAPRRQGRSPGPKRERRGEAAEEKQESASAEKSEEAAVKDE